MGNGELQDACTQIARHISGAVACQIGQDDGEFLAPVARGQLSGALGRGGDGLGDAAKAFVPHVVPQMVIVRLEMIDIDHEQGQGRRVSLGPVPLALQDGVEFPAVGDAGQAVAIA